MNLDLATSSEHTRGPVSPPSELHAAGSDSQKITPDDKGASSPAGGTWGPDEKRRCVLLAWISDVIANVPVERCAIVKEIKRVIEKNIFCDAELGWLAFMKLPCAISKMLERLAISKHALYSLAEWQDAAAEVVELHGADQRVAGFSQEYYSQFINVTTRRERNVVNYICKLMSGMSKPKFKRACREFRPDWGSPNLAQLSSQFVSACGLGSDYAASDYKPLHAMRTVQAAFGKSVPMADLRGPLLDMSEGVRHMRSWFYPASVQTAAQAHAFLKSELETICHRLGVLLPERIEHALKVMSTGDEACLMCEGSHCESFTTDDVQLMETTIRSGFHDTWRAGRTFTGKATQKWTVTETEESGVFVGPIHALAALRTCKQKQPVDNDAYDPPSDFEGPSATEQMEFHWNRPTSRGAAVECMQRLTSEGDFSESGSESESESSDDSESESDSDSLWVSAQTSNRGTKRKATSEPEGLI
jgi:hypothetical protein